MCSVVSLIVKTKREFYRNNLQLTNISMPKFQAVKLYDEIFTKPSEVCLTDDEKAKAINGGSLYGVRIEVVGI